jgi:hypothetical protein
VLQYRVLRRILEFKGEKVTGVWKKLNHEDLNDLSHTQYCLGDQIEKHEMGRACYTMRERRGVDRGLVGKPEGKRPLGSEDNIKMDLQEVVCEGID